MEFARKQHFSSKITLKTSMILKKNQIADLFLLHIIKTELENTGP